MHLGDLGGAFAAPHIEQLRKLVSKVLCTQSDFEEGIFRISERMLKRGQGMCGIFFCLHGPRSVKLTAVWECEQNSIRFYGSNGEKFKTITLDSSNDSQIAAA
ncbi:hypothetical protein MFFC18_17750 [Mariniblastus fucicola]|uniref:Uncharacterized protein n=1 Tax=Mariniblastus fucicola TaxID=980251 RepID=A0A5B9P6L3_9BACT|nr:hypothetical protein MFFC18_17750 [Mariniblastus fucicola]